MQRTPTQVDKASKLKDLNPARLSEQEEARLMMEILETQFIESRHNWYLAKAEGNRS